MSNFNCPECGTAILEGEGGHYVTGCKHYPVEEEAGITDNGTREVLLGVGWGFNVEKQGDL